jgi:hypothetical protein
MEVYIIHKVLILKNLLTSKNKEIELMDILKMENKLNISVINLLSIKNGNFILLYL